MEVQEAREGKQMTFQDSFSVVGLWHFLADTSPSGVSARVFKSPRLRRADYL